MFITLVGCNTIDSPGNPDVHFDVAQDASGQIDGPDGRADLDEDPQNDSADSGCTADQCDIDGECYDNETPNPDNPCEICQLVTDPFMWTPDDSASCDDGDPCTTGDACFEGACSALVVTCDDGNPCTTNTCDIETGECTSEPASGSSCEDGNPCTIGDSCLAGTCEPGIGTAPCDDGNMCTADSCDSVDGCMHEPLSEISCDDGNQCTVGDSCVAGQCATGAEEMACDDDDLCTVDGCDRLRGCVYTSVSHLCVDENPCTDEACDPETGCVFPSNDDFCNDLNACTEDDQCSEGACLGTSVDVTGDVCNVLSCDPDLGVSVQYTELPCSDADACTVGDTCASGDCISGLDEPNCDDENVCTDDDCDPQEGCTHEDNTDECNDNDACTEDDICGDGTCEGEQIDCDDHNVCTQDKCSRFSGCDWDLIVSNSCRPQFSDIFPERAATVQGVRRAITVTGTVQSGAGDITSLLLNGVELSVGDDGSFSHQMTPIVGGNILVFEATDSWGTTRKRVQSFLWSRRYRAPTEPKNGMVTEGLGIFLSQDVLDDGEREAPPNDFAGIFELVMASIDMMDAIDNPVVATTLYDVHITSISYEDPSVYLDSNDGRLTLTIVMDKRINPGSDVRFRAGLFLDTLWDENGSFTATRVTITADVALAVDDNHNIVATVADDEISVVIEGGDFSFDGFIVDAIASLFRNSLVSTMETEFASAIQGQIEPILEDALGGLAFDQVIPFPKLNDSESSIEVRLVTDFEEVDIAEAGITFIERAGAYADDENSYDNRGAMARSGCALGTQTLPMHDDAALEIGLTDDLLNELLYSAWQGGMLEFVIPPEMLGDLDLPAGVSDLTMVATGMLQPTAADCNADGELRLFVGDLRVDASMSVLGSPLDVVIYASFEGGLELSAGESEVNMTMTDISQLETEITIVQDSLVSLESEFESLIAESLVPALLGALGGDTLGGFPLPEIDLSGTVDGVPDGTVIAIDPEDVFREAGNSFVQGGLR